MTVAIVVNLGTVPDKTHKPQMLTIWSKNAVLALSMASVGQAFQANRAGGKVSTTALHVATDPSVVTKKEYQDICGVNFDKRSLQERLQATNFLYPKHVEVIEDIAPIASAMVDEIVSGSSIAAVCLLLMSSTVTGLGCTQRCSDHLSFSSMSSYTYARGRCINM